MHHYIDKNRIIETQRNVLDDKMRPLTRTIINTQLKSKKECDEYMKKLAVDIIAHYSLGSPENAQVNYDANGSQILFTPFAVSFANACGENFASSNRPRQLVILPEFSH